MPETCQHRSAPRILELDALRALAAVNLMLFHFVHVYSVKHGYHHSLGFDWPYGKYGVQLFFMLSGYVNAMVLFRKKDVPYFLISRSLRILPLFYLAIGLNLIWHCLPPLSGSSSLSWSQFWANLSVMPNLLGQPCLEPVMWTLQVELIFYGLIACLFVSGGLDRPLRPLLMYLTLCLVGGQFASSFADSGGLNWSGKGVLFLNELLILNYMPLFSMGIFLHWYHRQPEERLSSSLGIVFAALVFHSIDSHHHNPFVTFGLTALLFYSAQGKISLLRNKPLIFLSSISYPLFLLHNNLGVVVIYALDWAHLNPLVNLLIAMLMAIGIAWFVSRYIEPFYSTHLSQFIGKNWRKSFVGTSVSVLGSPCLDKKT